MSNLNYRRHSGSLFTGVIIITIGVYFLLKSLGFLVGINLSDYWPLLLVFFGLFRIYNPHSKGSYFWGPLIALTGGLFLAKNLHYINYDIAKLWPVIPIVIGISILLRPYLGPYHFHHQIRQCNGHRERKLCKDDSVISDDELSISLVLSGGDYNCSSSNFKGGNISLTLSGCEIDLRNVTTAQDEIFLDVNLLLGGIEMRIPDTWSVTYAGTPVLGSFQDNTRSTRSPEKKLIVRGSITLAGFEVRN